MAEETTTAVSPVKEKDVHVVYRQMSAYTEASLLIGVFRTEALAKKAKGAYIDKMALTQDAIHFSQGYQDVNLQKDVVITKQVLNHIPSQFADNPDEIHLSDDEPTTTLAPGHLLWVVSCQSEGMGQMSRGPACLFTSAARQEDARLRLKSHVDHANWPTWLVGDQVRLDEMRTRNLDLWTGKPLTEEEEGAEPITQVRLQLSEHVRDSIDRYSRMQSALERIVVGTRDTYRRRPVTFCQDWKQLLEDVTWPGVMQLHQAHGIVLVWLSTDDRYTSATNPLDVLKRLEQQCESEAGSQEEQCEISRTHALRYLLSDFYTVPISDD
jgi:hypothetical protein